MTKAWFLVLAACICGCHCGKETAQADVAPTTSISASTAKVIIYRTRTDHRDQVPVSLSTDHRTILSYPHPRDLRSGTGSLMLPTDLGKGWLLDNRGIGPDVAFLAMDYATYSALPKAPSLQELDSLVADRDPLLELWDCGSRNDYNDLVGELSAMVRTNGFGARCKQLK